MSRESSTSKSLSAQVSYEDIVKGETWGLDDHQLALTEAEATAADIHKLSRWLINPSPEIFVNPEIALYADYLTDNNRRITVPLNPNENKKIIRAQRPIYLGRTIVTQTLSGKHAQDPSMERQTIIAEEFSRAAIVKKLDSMVEVCEVLSERQKEFERFNESVENPHLLRRRRADSVAHSGLVFFHLIPDTLKVIGRLKGWSDVQHDTARRSIYSRIFLESNDEKKSEKLNYGKELMQLLSEYNQQKINLFSHRIGIAKQYLDD